MGIICKLDYAFNFIYRAEFENKLIEHEFDHVFIGYYDDEPCVNEHEVMEWNWFKPQDINKLLHSCPEVFTEWFKLCYEKVVEHIDRKISKTA